MTKKELPIYQVSENDEQYLETKVIWKKGGLKLPVQIFGENVTLSDFDPIRILGRGSFGKVYLVKFKDTGE